MSSTNRFLLAAISIVLMASPAAAQQEPAAAQQAPDFTTGIWTRSNLLGDAGGVRSTLGNYGISLGLQDTNEVLGNATGGVRQGSAYDGLTQIGVGLDTMKAFGWEGGTFNLSILQIRGSNLSTSNLRTLQTASGIEAQSTTRLWELWYQQAFLDGRFDLKLGQQSLDQEFITSQGSSLFINTMMGWPALPSLDMYAGGPAYPLSSLGVRLRDHPAGSVTLLGGAFDDNPPGGPFNNDSQLRDAERWGVRFNTTTGVLFIGEIQYALNQPAEGDVSNAPQSGLPGTYKLGFWYDTGKFFDQRFDAQHLSLADPASSGVPRTLWNNFSIYAVADQVVWQPDPQGPRALGVFLRVMGAPGDRNLISFSANGGVTLKAPLPGRDNDTAGIGFGVAKVSGSASGLDKDTAFFTETPFPVRSTETFIEATYQLTVVPWFQLQPDFQYVFLPGGGIPNPSTPGRRIANEAVFILRSVVTF
jgi:porin